jgi:hypothetical protein
MQDCTEGKWGRVLMHTSTIIANCRDSFKNKRALQGLYQDQHSSIIILPTLPSQGFFTIISLYAQMLKNACPQCIEFDIFTFKARRIHNLTMHWLSNLRFGREVVLEL